MSVKTISQADRKLFKDILEVNELTERIPRYDTFFSGVKDIRELMTRDQTAVGRHTQKSGFGSSGIYQRVACIPLAVAAFIKDYDPDFFKSKEKLYWFLKEFPMFDMRANTR